MIIKIIFKKPITIFQDDYTAQVNFLKCKSIELNSYGMVKIDGEYYCNELDILKIEMA